MIKTPMSRIGEKTEAITHAPHENLENTHSNEDGGISQDETNDSTVSASSIKEVEVDADRPKFQTSTDGGNITRQSRPSLAKKGVDTFRKHRKASGKGG